MNAKPASILFLVLLAMVASVAHGGTINIPLVTVGDPGNVADPLTGYGAVPYVYEMGEFDVTVGQYCQFLNAVAKTDTYGLYNAGMAPRPLGFFPTLGIAQSGTSGNYSYSVAGSYSQAANCPIFDVSWGDAARFVNWLANDQAAGVEGPGTTETGTYTLNGATSNAALMAVSRNPGSTWVLPTVNEWYKSAYYVGGGTNAGYWTYATQSNDTPSNVLSATGTNNANFAGNGTGGATDPVNVLTPVGAFAASPGPYGTFDENGDVYQWNETAFGVTARGFGGGGYGSIAGALISESIAGGAAPMAEDSSVGFRVASVPEPAAVWLLFVSAVLLAVIKVFLLLVKKQITRRWTAVWDGAIAPAKRFFRDGWTAARHPNFQRVKLESLRLEFLEERRLLTGSLGNLFWGGGTTSWNSTNWYPTQALSPGTETNWTNGYTAYVQGASCTINANNITVEPFAIFFGSGEANGPYTVSGGTIALSANTSIDVAPDTTATIDSNITNVTGTGGEVAKYDTGRLVLGGANNTYTGGTDIEYGTVQLANSATLGADTGTLTVDEVGTLDLNGCSITVGSLVGGANGSGTITDTSTTGTYGGVTRFTVANNGPDTFKGSISDSHPATSYDGPQASSSASIRLVKSGTGVLTLTLPDSSPNGSYTIPSYTGGTEIDAGTLQLGGPYTLPYEGPLTVNSPGVLDLHNQLVDVSTLNGNGTVTDYSAQGGTTTLEVDMYGTSPSVFAGQIEDGTGVNGQKVALGLDGEGILTLTGNNTYTGGTFIEDGWLQIGDGQTNGMITGPVADDSIGGLTFDMAVLPPNDTTVPDFNGVIYTDMGRSENCGADGSVVKTGPGPLEMTFDEGSSGYSSFAYRGDLRVEGGTLELANANTLPSGTSLTVENGATLNLNGNSFAVATVTLNGGSSNSMVSSIISTNANGTNTSATLTASESYDFASGSIGASVTLAGSATLTKRTTGTVTLYGPSSNYSYSGGTFVDAGTLSGSIPAQTAPQPLYWEPNWNINHTVGGTGIWDTSTYSLDWSTSSTGGTPVAWQDGDIAVFSGSAGTVTVDLTFSPAEIDFKTNGYDLESGELLIPSYGTNITAETGVKATLGCVIAGGGDLTKEGSGEVDLTGPNNVSFYGGTFIDAGKVQLGSQTADPLGNGSGELTVDDTGELDLNGNAIKVASLSSAGSLSGTITDNSAPSQENPGPTVLTVDVATDPGVFGGLIEDGVKGMKLNLTVECAGSGEGVLLTITGQNTYTGGTVFDGGLQIGDGTTNGSIVGQVDVGLPGQSELADGIIFDVAAGTETFNGSLLVNNNYDGFLLKTGAGTLILNGDNTYPGATGVDGGVLQLGDNDALPAGTNLTIYTGTLDLGNYKTQELASVTLVNGSIWQEGLYGVGTASSYGVGTAQSYGKLVSDNFTLENGYVSANLAGPGGLTQDGSGITNSMTTLWGYDTYAGYTYVAVGTLTDNAIVGTASSLASVASGATLGGSGTLNGSVTVRAGGVLSLGCSTDGAAITIGALQLDNGSIVQDIVGSEDTYLADIIGALIINPTVSFNTTVSGSGTVPYQVIFQYGSLNSGGFGNLTAKAGTNLINNTPATSIDLGNPAGGTSGPTPLYWAGVLNGIWNGSTSNTDWLSLPTNGVPKSWPATNQSNYVAIFENLGQSQTVTIDNGFPASPAATFILGNFTITTGTGQFSLGTGGAPITVGAGITAVITAPVSGGALVANLTGGTLNLTNGGNSYNGGTTINGGTLQVTSSSCLGSGATITFDGGTLGLYQPTGALDFSASVSVVLDQAGGTIDANGSDVKIDGAISGSGGLTKIGNNTLTLTADSNYTGATTINAGILNIQNGSALGTMAGGVNVANGATLQLQFVPTNGSSANGFEVSPGGNATLNLSGSGDLVNNIAIGALDNLFGQNTWSGPILLSSPIGTPTQIDSDSGILILTGGINGDDAGSTLAFDGTSSSTVSSVGIGSNVAYVTENSSGTLTLKAVDYYTVSLTVTNGGLVAYAGAIPWGTGCSIGGGGGTIFNAAPVYSSISVANGATLDLGGFSVTVTGSVTLGNGSITDGTIVDNDAYSVQNGTISANLGGSAGLTMSGTGTVDLTGNNSYTGGMTIDSGTLILAGSDTFSGATVVCSGSTLTVAATGTLTIAATGSLTVASGGSIVVASGGTLNNEGTLNDAAAVLGGTGTDNIVNSGTLVLDGQGTQTLDCQLSGSGNLAVTCGATFDLAGDNLTFAAVTVNGGSVIDSSGGNGALTASGFTLSNTTINAALYDSTGTDTVTGTVILNDQTYNSLLNNLDVTSHSTLDVNGGTATLGGSTTNYGTLAVGSVGLFYNGGTFTNENYAVITVASGGDFYNGPNLAGTAGGKLYNYGTITNNGYFQNEGASLSVYSALSNYGTITNNSGSTYYNGWYADYTGSGYFTNYGSFVEYGYSSVVNAGVDFVNWGTFAVSGPGTTFVAQSSSGFYNESCGTVNVSGGASFTITMGSINNAGTFNVTASTLNVDSGTTLYNSGAINLATDAVFNNWGIVDDSPGSVTCPSGCAVNNHGTWVGNQPVA
ncbi:MAG: autotransporter-associated beta strand repeat-containing protein [Thermoguttaceae bacterium]